MTDGADDGVRMIPIETPTGQFSVWTKRVGDNPRVKVLLLHGGPGATHEYLEVFEQHLRPAGVEFFFYDQLGAGNSDAPDEPSLWDVDRFVDEVEQVRVALGLTPDDFVLFGHSWGGILAIEYALAHQQALRGLVISNMMASAPEYTAYAEQELIPRLDPAVVTELRALEAAGDFGERYDELLTPYYEDHILRRPQSTWPDSVQRAFAHINPQIYVSMQGPSEMGMSPEASLAQWDRFDHLPRIDVPTLVIGAEHDTMDPAHMRRMADAMPNGRFLLCPDGSHMAFHDDEATYFAGLLDFLRTLDGRAG